MRRHFVHRQEEGEWSKSVTADKWHGGGGKGRVLSAQARGYGRASYDRLHTTALRDIQFQTKLHHCDSCLLLARVIGNWEGEFYISLRFFRFFLPLCFIHAFLSGDFYKDIIFDNSKKHLLRCWLRTCTGQSLSNDLWIFKYDKMCVCVCKDARR